MKLPLDTQTLPWFLAGDNRLSPRVRAAVGCLGAELYLRELNLT